jgi:hypothetical protein
MKKALKQLINALDKVFEQHEEVGDTAVRQFMYGAVHESFIVPQVGYELPDEFGMFSAEGNRKVCAALRKFLTHPEVVAAATGLKTAQERLDAFQDVEVDSSEGNTYDEYFGYFDCNRFSLGGILPSRGRRLEVQFSE